MQRERDELRDKEIKVHATATRALPLNALFLVADDMFPTEQNTT